MNFDDIENNDTYQCKGCGEWTWSDFYVCKCFRKQKEIYKWIRKGKSEMKCKQVYYEELKSEPGFNNKKIGIWIELEGEEKAEDALIQAKAFVKNELNSNSIPV